MKYHVVFDLLASGYRNWWFPAFGLIFIVVGTVILVLQRRGTLETSSRWKAVLPYVFIGFATLWVLGTFAQTYGDYRALRRAVVTGQAQVVEGVVTDFFPMPYEGHQQERFTVNGHEFAYSDYTVMAGFNNTTSHGGPVRSGLRVRVTFVGNEIVRLEVAQ